MSFSIGSHTLRAIAALTLVLAALGLYSSPAAALTSYTVTTTDDVVATDGLMSLREAFILSNLDGDHSSIVLAAGQTYELDVCQAKEPTEGLGGSWIAPDDEDESADGDLDHYVSHDLTLYGNGSTITQSCLYDRVIHSSNADTHLVIDDTIIRDGGSAPDYGDNIWSLGSLTLQNDTMVTAGHDFGSDGYAVQVGDSGDYNPAITFTIDDSTITDNDENGARLDYGTLVADGAIVTDNEGSGLVASFAIIGVDDSTITGNLGGGISGIDSTATVDDSTISDNGLGISASGNTPDMSHMVISDSTVDGNERGGASCSYCGSITVIDSSITNNGSLAAPAGSFGGLRIFTYDVNPGLTVSGSTLSGNRTAGDGGAINARFVDEGFGGGALPVVAISNSNVFDNRSGILSDGGAIYVEGAAVSVTDGSSFNENWAKPDDVLSGGNGGAIWVGEGGSLSISDSYLTGNRAQGSGGAIYGFDLEQAQIDTTLLSDNEAIGSSGGAVYLHSVPEIEIDDSTITDNLAQQGGAGLRFSSFGRSAYSIHIDGSTIARNSGRSRGSLGGGLYADGALTELAMVNSTVTENQSWGTGAGVRILGNGAVNLEHVTMVGNESTSGEVANIYHQNGDLTSLASVIAVGVGGPDCGTFSGAVNSLGYNLAGDNSCGFVGASDDTGVVALALSPLANNGGPTPTRRPAKSSPLVNVIPVADCPNGVDQRNEARPAGTNCDVGAVEVEGFGAGPGDFKPTPPRPTPPGSVTLPPKPKPDPGRGSGPDPVIGIGNQPRSGEEPKTSDAVLNDGDTVLKDRDNQARVVAG